MVSRCAIARGQESVQGYPEQKHAQRCKLQYLPKCLAKLQKLRSCWRGANALVLYSLKAMVAQTLWEKVNLTAES